MMSLLIGAFTGFMALAAEPPSRPNIAAQMGLLNAEFSPVDLHSTAPGKLRAVFTIDGRPLTVNLTPHSVRSPNFKAFTTDGQGRRKEISLPPETTYQGTVPDMPKVRVAASICDGKFTALIKDERNRFWAVEPALKGAPAPYAVYRALDVNASPKGCEARVKPQRSAREGADEGSPQEASTSAAEAVQGSAPPGTAIAEIAFDTDFEFYTSNNSSTSNTIADIESIMNGINLIYENDVAITHHIVSINVRTSSGAPYTSTDSGTLLDQMEAEWKANFVGVPRDIAHLMTGKNLDGSTIGLAYIGVICDGTGRWGFGYGLSQSTFSANFQNRIAVTAHELGHNWNAEHDATGNIMCSSIGGCSGSLDSFAPIAINTISTFRDSRACLGVVPANAPDLLVTKTVDKGSVAISDLLNYTLAVTNTGTSMATGVMITDTLPTGLSFVSATPSSGITVDGQDVTYDVGTLNAGEHFSLLLTASADTLGIKDNTAFANANETELVESNNQDSITSEVLPALQINEASLLFTGIVNGPFDPSCQSISLSNLLSSAIDWVITSGPTWLDINLMDGLLTAGGNTTIDACLNNETEAFTSGTYTDNIVFSNQTTGLTTILPVSLVLKAVAQMPFTEGFETGALANFWKATGTSDFRIQVTDQNSPDSGSYHVTMDDSTARGYSINELTLSINLEQYTNVVLSYRGKDFSDEAHLPPAGPFGDSQNFDGIAISDDGINWYPITDFTDFSNSYKSYQIDLDQAIATNGLAYNQVFNIRFNQYDNFSISSDGVALDNISLTGTDRSDRDLDDDGLPNDWELQFFGNSTNALPSLDGDGDGVTNFEEFIADTNPTSDVSFLQFIIAPSSPGGSEGIELSYVGSTGRVYSIFCRTNAVSGDWVQHQTNQFGNGGVSSFFPETLSHCGLFRLEVALPPAP